ncbi:PP2C family protein-serine/threonine phosphatase [Nocardioides imazamoxiresistens]|uniref:PP2C family protein-serine/threonine phosphatase n=1 Tax=Nocardioides imazamoxiresistens TaxID=3231893 RepID=UPI0028E6D159|nr:PP2C family protein-serine/threonine phosphatase [Nocardioides zeae]
MRDLRRSLTTNRALVTLVAMTTVLGLLVAWRPERFPLNTLTIPMVVSTLFLRPRQLAGYITFALAVLALATTQQETFTPRLWASVATYTFIGLFVLGISLRRVQLGVGGAEGEAMLVDLRDRLQAQGEAPPLPDGWELDATVRAAGGTPFSGDFFCYSSCTEAGRLDAVLVDVSGKGVSAGTRSLQLSGALSGLLGAVPPAQILPAVNDFLIRQSWQEGFATAVHLSLDLRTGQYDVYVAGHPPPLALTADGRARRLGAGGPLLGLIGGAAYPADGGELRPGEALVLYTDGLVEVAGLDIDEGIDRLADVAAHQLERRVARRGPDVAVEPALRGVADALIAATGTPGDDRAVLVLRRA